MMERMVDSPNSDWNSFARTNASQRWRKPSAAMGRAMTEAIVAEAQIVHHLRVLDVASGTGEPAISIATALNGTGMVTATDISAEPLAIGEQRARERNLANIRFRVADVHALPFPDNSFERVTCRLGAMFFSELPRALSEIHRVVTKDGRITLLAWGPMQQPYFDVTIGTVLHHLPNAVVPASAATMFKFGTSGSLSKSLQDAGFQNIDERQSEVPWNWPGPPEDFWAYFQDVTVPFKPLLQSIPDPQRDQINSAVLKELRDRYDGIQIQFNAQIVLVSATKSSASS
jgi:ubiquinone/menaquinone biosynthesis C-methylase UbiE